MTCETCIHWRRLSAYRGQCRLAPFTTNAYRLVGATGPSLVFEETKPTHSCVQFQVKP